MAPGEALVAMTLFLTIGGAVVLRGPIGKALADLEDMKHRVAELEGRQDFTERVLAAHREPNRLER